MELPKDNSNLVFWMVFLIGFTILLPWNILITVSGFWDYKFRNITQDGLNMENSTTTDLQKLFASYVAIASNVPNATFIILHALIGHKFPMKLRLYGSQIGMVITLAFITILSKLDSDDWQDLFLNLTIVGIVFVNTFSAVFQGCVSSLLSPFPPEYLGHWVNGAGMGGLVPSLLNVVFLAVNPDVELSGFVCFVFALAITIITLGLTFLMERSEFYQFYSSKLYEDKEKEKLQESTFRIYLNFGASVWIYILITLLNFTGTLCVFPAVTVLAQSYEYSGSQWDEIYYVAVCCFVIFNFADYAGKQLAVWIQKPGPSPSGQLILLIAALLRLAFIPLFMFCYVSVDNRNTEIVFYSDWLYIIFMIIFGLSNGYIGNIACMFGPKVVKVQNYQVKS